MLLPIFIDAGTHANGAEQHIGAGNNVRRVLDHGLGGEAEIHGALLLQGLRAQPTSLKTFTAASAAASGTIPAATSTMACRLASSISSSRERTSKVGFRRVVRERIVRQNRAIFEMLSFFSPCTS